MIRLDGISLIFGLGTPDENEALKNISLTVKSGDFITIIGSNGAGKTSLYNAVAGTCPLTAGRIFIRPDIVAPATAPPATAPPVTTAPAVIEREITREPEYKRARYIGRIFQNPLLGTAGRMTLADNMMI
jgi:putative ABC transport system ATP-binding protein